MATLNIKTAIAALLAGSLAATAGGVAYARAGNQGIDPVQFQQRLDKRVDKALGSTDATTDQKKQVSDILKAAFTDLRAMHAQRVENRKAMVSAMEAPTIDPAKIEQIRAEQMKVADASSKRLTKALVDAGNVLNASQRQAFFKNWSERQGGKRPG